MLIFHETKDPGRIESANSYLEDRGYGSLKRIIGYYGDRECAEQTFEPVLLIVRRECPACADPTRTNDCADCETCDGSGDGSGDVFTYYPGYRCDDYHSAQEGIFDMSDGYESAEASDAPELAAREAHSIAEREAEKESEYQEKERARMLVQEMLPDEIRQHRCEHSALIGAILKYRDGRYDNASCVRDRAALRGYVKQAVKRIRELRLQFDFTKE